MVAFQVVPKVNSPFGNNWRSGQQNEEHCPLYEIDFLEPFFEHSLGTP